MKINLNIDLNKEFKKALDLVENSTSNVFITGRAGTGKSTLLNYFKKHTRKNVVVLAPTGVAAVNIGGQTIHSFFHFKPDITLQKVRKLRVTEESRLIYQKLETIVIDEISMVRADLLDCVDLVLRLYGPRPGFPFGGVQMVFIGDLYQLPPVVAEHDRNIFVDHYESPYFFSAHVFNPKQKSLLSDREIFRHEFIELNKMYRQKDAEFINILNAIRDNVADEKVFEYLNKRVDASFDAPESDMFMYLTTTNAMANTINEEKLNALDEDLYFFSGVTEGNFEDSYLPTAKDLSIKIGAQVMMLNNDVEGRWINGSVGKVLRVDGGENGDPRSIVVLLESGSEERVFPHKWDVYSFNFNSETNHIESDTVGSFTQYPLKLAWAVTIHKSQGKTFEKVVIDIGRGTFSAGQLYVALSRATSLEGIVLKRPIFKQHVWLDNKVHKFMGSFKKST